MISETHAVNEIKKEVKMCSGINQILEKRHFCNVKGITEVNNIKLFT